LRPSLKHEFCDDAEVLTRTPQAPEEIWILVLACSENISRSQNDLAGDEVVDDEAVPAAQPAVAAAEGKAPDAGISDCAADGGEAVLPGGVVNVGPLSAALDGKGAGGGVDSDGAHGGEVDDEATVDGRGAGSRVTPATNSEVQGVGRGVGKKLGNRGGGFREQNGALEWGKKRGQSNLFLQDEKHRALKIEQDARVEM
jgi:hypothetical protein